MKKFLIALLSLSLLASCGSSDGGKDNGGDAGKTASACDSYIEYMKCTYKKANMDDATIKTNLDQVKAAWGKVDKAQMENMCKTTIEQAKKAPTVPGCELK